MTKKFEELDDEQLAAFSKIGTTLIEEYRKLRDHHVEETTELLNRIKQLEMDNATLQDKITSLTEEFPYSDWTG